MMVFALATIALAALSTSEVSAGEPSLRGHHQASFFFGRKDISTRRRLEEETTASCSEEEFTIDFSSTDSGETLSKGSVIDADVALKLVRFQARRIADYNMWDYGMIFDAAGDSTHDLSLPEQGNVLIISASNNTEAPSENINGGVIEAIFDAPVLIKGLKFIGTDRSGGIVEFYNADWDKSDPIEIPVTGPKSKTTVETSQDRVVYMRITMVGRGAIDDIVAACEAGEEDDGNDDKFDA